MVAQKPAPQVGGPHNAAAPLRRSMG